MRFHSDSRFASEKSSIKSFPEIRSGTHSPHVFNIHFSSEVPREPAKQGALNSGSFLLPLHSVEALEQRTSDFYKLFQAKRSLDHPSLAWKAAF